MTEFFLPFLIGYGVARVLSFMLRSNIETAPRFNEETVILRWCSESFGWRPCTLLSVESSSDRYMLAAPINYDELIVEKINTLNDQAT